MRDALYPRRRLAVSLRAKPAHWLFLRERLAEHQIDVVAADDMADVHVVDLRHTDTRGRCHWATAVNVGRREQGTKPLIFLADPLQMAGEAATKVASTDILVPWTISALPLITAIRRAVAETAMAAELALRVQAMALLNLPLPAFTPPAPTPKAATDSCLLLTEPGPAALALLHELMAHTSVYSISTHGQALYSLEHGGADALLILAARNRRSQSGLVKLLRRQQDLSSLPIIALEPHITPRHMAYWSKAGVDAVVASSEGQLAACLASRAARARRTALATEALLTQMTFSDQAAASRLACSRFFDACLAQRCEHIGKTPFTLGVLRLDPHQGSGHRAALSEVAVYAAMAAHAMDLVARPAPDVLVISMPGADKAHGAATMQSFTRMVADLKFGDRHQGCTFTARTHVVTARPGDTPQSLLAALFRGVPALTEAALLWA